jgi:hypothetical protein
VPSQESIDIIRAFIIERGQKGVKTTKTDVVKYMETVQPESIRTSRDTTRKILSDLESSGIITVSKGDRRGQSHYLTINDKNEFNLIDKELSEIQNIMNGIGRNAQKMNKESERQNLNRKNIGLSRPLDHMFEFYLEPCIESINIILRILLFKTYKEIHSENYLQILYAKIINLMLKISKQTPEYMNDTRKLRLHIEDLKDTKGWTEFSNRFSTQTEDDYEVKKREYIEALDRYAEEIGIEVSKFDNTILKIDRFRQQYLNNTSR